jgi:hypothetical protein
MNLGLTLHVERDAVSSVLRAADALDGDLVHEAELAITVLATPALVLGAFQRGTGAPEGLPLVRRVSGGALVRVGPGTLHVVLRLRSPSALVPCNASKLTNRHVRPLLRALAKGGALAHYFGRDWVSVGHRPVGAVGFAHDSKTGRAVFEAFVAVREPYSEPRTSFLGKEPGTLEAVMGRSFDPAVLAKLIADAYLAFAGATPHELAPRAIVERSGSEDALRSEPPWAATVGEVIGAVAAGRDANGVLRLGGDFLASRDAVARVESEVGKLAAVLTLDAVGAIVNEAFLPPAVIDGVKDLRSLQRVLLDAGTQAPA